MVAVLLSSLPEPASAGAPLPEEVVDVGPAEAAQIAKYLPLIQQIEAIERIKAVQQIKKGKGNTVPPFLPIVLALHHRSEQGGKKKKLRLLRRLFGGR
ncbi:hypothetical protein HPB48_018453 [Haemaphysalis longicornis]|uniref:Uncharacterized protein n=1 Tax=Haemaphysalis longicornis TaxID=44386 RepID=A0A9J6FWU4_HAELO|nr:hypothetical protein HPB48_018453 [Haemaphysalis longicornis]